MVEVTDGSGHDAPFIGVCALDTAAGQILLGSWRDDEVGVATRNMLQPVPISDASAAARPVQPLPRTTHGLLTARRWLTV